MTSKFAQNVLKEVNTFRANPHSIQHQCEVIRKGFSRLRANDPFLNEIDSFVADLKSKKPLPTLELNEALCKSAEKILPSFRGSPSFNKYRKDSDLKGIVPDRYLSADPAMTAVDGADEPVNVLTMILLDKNDVMKDGRSILLDPRYTQIGIGHEEFEGENMVILLFASRYISDEPTYPLPDGDLSELKMAFDALDVEGNQNLDMNRIMDHLDEMEFDKTDPTLCSIFDELAKKDTCSWPKFAYIANKRMTDRATDEGLETIFNLFIDNPKKQTITFPTFKKICDEIDCELSEQQLRDILQAATENGNEITFDEFKKYMYEPEQEGDEERIIVKTEVKKVTKTSGGRGKK